MKAKKTEVIVVGSINSDSSFLMKHLPGAGETVLSTKRFDAPGGKGANQAAALAALGVSVEFFSAVGNDDPGRELVKNLAGRGVRVEGIVTIASEPTGSAIILVSESGENSIIVHVGANGLLTPDHIRTKMTSHASSIILTQLEIPLDAVLEASKSSHAKFIVNPAPMPAQSVELDQIIEAADILVPNRSELAILAGSPIPETLAELIECARKVNFNGQLVVTLGAEGALVFPDGTTGAHKLIPAPQVNTIDTSGAGDAFCAALTAALARNETLEDATVSACEFAAWTTTQEGAQVPA